MSQPFLGEIRLVSFSSAPSGFAPCNGQTLQSADYPELFKVLGTTYGGDGTTFKLPDLRGRAPVHSGAIHLLGQSAGTETVTLTRPQMPEHAHTLNASATSASSTDPADNVVAKKARFGMEVFAPANNPVLMSTGALLPTGATGTDHSHNNMQPYLALNFVIAVVGAFPSPD